MRTIKKIDLAGQVLLIVCFIVVSIIKRDTTFLTGYTTVALWQSASIVIHFVNKWHPLKGGRRYNFLVFVTALLVLTCLASVIPFLFFFLHLLVFIIPLLEVSYSCICFMEVFYYLKRPLDLI